MQRRSSCPPARSARRSSSCGAALKNNQIGRGVVLHPSMPIMGRFSHHIDVLNGTEASVYVDDRLVDRGYALESMADQPLYAASMSPGPALHSFEMIKAFRDLARFGVMLIDTAQSENRIRLDEEGSPEIDYTLSGADKRRFPEALPKRFASCSKPGRGKFISYDGKHPRPGE